MNGQLEWQTWDIIWANLEVLLPKARSLVSGQSTVLLSEQYPSTSHFGADLSTLVLKDDFLPTSVSKRQLPALLLRFLAGNKTLTECVWELPANSGGIACERFIVDELGDLNIVCHQVVRPRIGRCAVVVRGVRGDVEDEMLARRFRVAGFECRPSADGQIHAA